MTYLLSLYVLLDIPGSALELGLGIFVFLVLLDWYLSEPDNHSASSVASSSQNESEPSPDLFNKAA
jgi:hypothetical protein